MSLMPSKSALSFVILVLSALATTTAFAHTEGIHAMTGFAAGFDHPFSGADHLLAMLAVGFWAAQQRTHAPIWVLPLAFPAMMALGAVAGFAGLQFYGVEAGVAGSVAVLGLLIAFAIKMPVWASAILVSLFAVMHGHAHGSEMPQGASAVLYGAGFIVATALLHLTGLLIGLIAGESAADKIVRLGGAAIAATGVFLLAA